MRRGTPGWPSPTDARNLDVVLDSSPRPQIHPSPQPAGSSSLPLTSSWSRLSPFTWTASKASSLAGPPLASITPRAAERPFRGMDLIAPPPFGLPQGPPTISRIEIKSVATACQVSSRLRRPLQRRASGTPHSLSPDGPTAHAHLGVRAHAVPLPGTPSPTLREGPCPCPVHPPHLTSSAFREAFQTRSGPPDPTPTSLSRLRVLTKDKPQEGRATISFCSTNTAKQMGK